MPVCTSCGAEGQGRFCGSCGGRMPEAPQLRELSHDKNAPFVARVGGAIPPGSKITVENGGTFYGMQYGGCELTLDKGVHTTEGELEDGWFIRSAGTDIPFQDDLGVMSDTHDQRGKVNIKGIVRAKIDEPKDFVSAQGSNDFDVEAMSVRVRTKVRELIDAEIRDLLAKDRYLTSVQSSKAIDTIKKALLSTWAGDAERDAFIAIEVPKLEVRCITITDAPPPPEPEPAVSAPPAPQSPAPFVPGARVHVIWSDGTRYPAIVRAAGCLVRFDDGQEHWIAADSLAEPSS
jgi:hypothetical protein